MSRRPALDGLRGVAILLVVGVHCFNWPAGGQLGVDVFFLLSGFLITSLLLTEHAATGRIQVLAFYRRRATRLLPALAVMLTAYLAIAAGKGEHRYTAAAAGGLYVANLVGAFGPEFGPLYHSGVDHLWSLAQEEHFYALWPFALPFIARTGRPVRWLMAATVALIAYRIGLALVGAPHHRLYAGPDTHVDGFVIGAAIAFLISRRPDWKLRPLWLAIAAPVAVDSLFVRAPYPYWDAFGLPLFEAAAAVVLIAALASPPVTRVFSVGPLCWLGRISYSLYLWHFMLMWAFGQRHGVMAALLAIAIAYTSTRWLEEPLRRRFRIRATATALPAAAPA